MTDMNLEGRISSMNVMDGSPWNVEYGSTEEAGEDVVGEEQAPARLYQPLPVHVGQADRLQN